jgi:hypothetical protein
MKQSRIELAKVIKSNRKSGEAEGSAVPLPNATAEHLV